MKEMLAITLHVLLRRDGFRWQWTLSWLVLIVINMSALSIVSTVKKPGVQRVC